VIHFFFQAEDGIRDFHVTGVQTCALPIWVRAMLRRAQETGEAFASVHRIMDAHGREKHLVLLGQGRRERESGEVVKLMGYVVDEIGRASCRERVWNSGDGTWQ